MPVKTKSALLEIGLEPLPARFVPGALAQLQQNAAKLLAEARLAHEKVRVVGTHRRLAVIIEGLAPKSEALKKRVMGPPAKLLRDAEGKFTPQALGFAKAHGVSPEELSTSPSTRGEVMVAESVTPGEAAPALLGPLFKSLIESLAFPKNMYWEESGFRFARPIRSLICLYGERVVPLKIAGVKSGRLSAPLSEVQGKPFPIKNAEGYVEALNQRNILVDPEVRRAALVLGLKAAAKSTGLQPALDNELMEETVFLTEHPVAVAGSFRREFLSLPEDFIVTTLRKQLKFFPLLHEGRIQARFVAVRDGLSEHQKEVLEGFERVVEARLDDAVFYFERDKKESLEEMRERLKGVLFHKDLGSLHDKSERVRALTGGLCEAVRQDLSLDEAAAEQIARLAYADLSSEVVSEFPELQGRMGAAYARLAGLPERVALGIAEFYRPDSARSGLPTTLEGSLASLAGKLDTIAGDFIVGLIPSGSEDPHGLRRQALGAVRILLEKQLPVSLPQAVEQALALQPAKGPPLAEVRAAVLDFVWQRLEGFLEEAGYKIDEIRAVKEGGLEDVPRTVKRVAALHAVRPQPEFASVAAAFKRASNILRQASFPLSNGHAVDPALLQEEAERGLFEALTKIEGSLQLRLQDGEFEESLRVMTALKTPVDSFFEKVLVNAESEDVRTNRYRLLAQLVRLLKSVADLSQLQG